MSSGDLVRDHPVAVTLALTAAAYAVVVGTFAGVFPYPEVELWLVEVMADAIALVNTAALACIVAGVYYARQRRLRLHRNLMLTATALILVFLVIYLFRVGGGGTKVFEGPETLRNYVYLPMLAVHLVLSIAAVPLVVHAVVLGLTRPLNEVSDTVHPRVGRLAAAAWAVSLFLGVVTYYLLKVYPTGFRPASVVPPL